MLNKALDEVGTSRVAIAALQSQLATYKQLHEADELIIGLKDQMLKSKDDIIEAQDKRYDRLAATKCTVTKWLWGIRSVKQCY